MDRTETLKQWGRFERNQLEALHLFFDSDAPKRIEASDEKTFGWIPIPRKI